MFILRQHPTFLELIHVCLAEVDFDGGELVDACRKSETTSVVHDSPTWRRSGLTRMTTAPRRDLHSTEEDWDDELAGFTSHPGFSDFLAEQGVLIDWFALYTSNPRRLNFGLGRS